MDDTKESFKDKWWSSIFANFRAEEAAAAAQRALRLVASNEQAEALRKIFARANFDLRIRVLLEENS